MKELLSQGVWQGIAGILALITLGLYLLDKKKKTLSCRVEAYPIVSVQKDVIDNVQILFNKKPVSNAHLLLIKILNSGNVDIVPADYVQQVTVNFGPSAKILDANISDSNPKDMDAKILANKNTVVLSPALINKKEWLIIKALVSNYESDTVSLSGRIVGITKIETNVSTISVPPMRRGRILVFLLLIFVVGILLILFLMKEGNLLV